MNILKNFLRIGILISGFCLVSSGILLAAQISLSMQNKSTREVIREIEKVSDYRFFYNDNLSGLDARITVAANNDNIRNLLEQIKQQAQISYIIKDNNQIVLSEPNAVASSTQQDTRKITGIVRDAYGEPVIGANILEKGVTNGVITDVDGNYSLEVRSNSVLVVSYIGYITQEITVGNRTTLDIRLEEDTKVLDEVIVIGYGTTKRKDFTGSVSSVRLEDSPIAMSANLNALEALKGNVSGLDIGATNGAGGEPSMQMRGQKSVSGSNDPLLVVDGVIFMGSIGDINPNDIASFDVLKDATSAAAYGSRSANGVIIITTKKGKTGKPIISFNATGSIQTWQNRPELMKGDVWLESVMARTNSTDLSWMTPQEMANREAGREINWLDESLRTGLVQDYQLSVSGAGERMNYYLSAAYSGNQGVVVGDQYDRITALAKVNTDITDWLQIGVDAAFSQSDYSGVGAEIGRATILSPYGVMYRDEANKLLEKYPSTQSQPNPLWGVTDGSRDNMDKRNNFRTNAFALVKLPWIEGLSYRFNYAGNLSKDQSGDFYYETHYVKEGAYNDESRYSPAAYQSLLASANGNLYNKTISSWVVDNILNYKNTFGKHTIDLTAVATRDRKKYEYIRNLGSNFAANGNTTLGLYGLHKATVTNIDMNNDNDDMLNNERSNIGYLGRASYSFDDRYFFTGSYRRDGASVFGINQKWGDFWAFGGAWRISSEKFMEGVSFLDDLKLKLSWGKNGNQGLDPYGTLSTINNGFSGGARYEFGGSNIIYGLNQATLGNADLGWESTESWNTGFESVWLGSRLFVDLDVYFSKTTDQIFTRDIPVMTGFKQMKSSMGQVNNRGVELTVRTVNVDTKDWMWMTNVTFWLNRNELVHLYGDDLDGDGKEDDDISNSRFIGKPIGAIYGYMQDGIVQETDVEYMKANAATPGIPKYKDLDGDGAITSEDRTILGYSVPNFKLNMSNTVTYKNWDLYVMLTGTFGGGDYYLKSNTRAFMMNGTGIMSANNIYVPWWTPENKSNVYPAATFSGDGGRFQGLQNRAFVRLQDVTLSYTFREPWAKDMKINNLKVFFTAKNLLTITDWEGGDPEVGVAVGNNTLPVLTSYTLGVNLSF